MKVVFGKIISALKRTISKKRILEFDNLTASFGVKIISKIDLRILDKWQEIKLQTLLRNRGMLIIPKHHILSDKEQVHLTGLFGNTRQGVNYISPHIRRPAGSNTYNTYLSSPLWHSDNSNAKNPAHISVFQMTQDAIQKWETLFISLHQLHDELAKDTSITWKHIDVMYSAEGNIHPLVWTHPFTGKPSIYFDFRFVKEIINKCAPSGTTLFKNLNTLIPCLNTLFDNKAFTYSHTWNAGDIVILDNYAISRKETSIPDYSEDIAIRRTTTEGIYF